MNNKSSNELEKKNIFSYICKLVCRKASYPKEPSVKEVIEEALDGENGKILSEDLSLDEKDMLRNMLDMSELTVADVMMPRADVIAIEHDITMSELKETFQKERHSRMPVFGNNLDDIKGFLHVKDMIPAFCGDEAFDMDNILRDVMFVVESMKIVDLLMQMRISREHLAIVVDEYGGTDGLVTMEDIFEEIVGEIQDEHDANEDEIEFKALGNGIYEVDARYEIEDLEEELDIKLIYTEEDRDVDTLGGLVFVRLGRVPARGEVLDIKNVVSIKILEADPRRISKLKLTLL